jgi:hypothetical protein
VKLCDSDASGTGPSCRLLHERVEAKTGSNVVKIEARDVAGTPDEKILIVSLKPNFRAAGGVQLVFYTADQWARFRNKEQVASADLKRLRIPAMACSAVECVARGRVGGRAWQEWPTFAGLIVFAMEGDGKPQGYAVSLEGFAATLAGRGIDSKIYARVRDRLVKQRGTEDGSPSTPGVMDKGGDIPAPAPPVTPVRPVKRPAKGGVDA